MDIENIAWIKEWHTVFTLFVIQIGSNYWYLTNHN